MTLKLNLGWTWCGQMLAHPVYRRQAGVCQAVHCLFYTILGSMDIRKKKLALDTSMCEMTEFSQHTPGFHVPCLIQQERHYYYIIMLCWLLKNEGTYECIVQVKYFELITRFMQIKKAFLYNKYYVTVWTLFARHVCVCVCVYIYIYIYIYRGAWWCSG
jgi:hypothetical protein